MRIEYEDRDIIVVYKEAGLPVQTGRTSGRDLVSMLKNHLAKETENAASAGGGSGQASKKNGAAGRQQQERHGAGKALSGNGPQEPYLGIVHRLDQPVEGLLVFAKTPKAAADLSRQTAAKGADAAVTKNRISSGKKDAPKDSGMEKIYHAAVVLSGDAYPLALEGRKRDVTLTDWILRDYANNTALITEEGAKDAKRAELTFRTLEIKGSRALVEIRLHTGRHHQIRVQMAHAGMPLAGDRKYGSADPQDRQLCLCAARLGFRHPRTGKRMQFQVQEGFSI